MKERPISKNFTKVVNILIFIFPIVIISLQVAGDIVLLILAIMGIFIAISRKLSPFAIKEIKVFSYLCIGYFIAVCLSVLFSGQIKELAHYIPRDFYFLFAPFIALTLYKAEINVNYLIVGAKVSLVVLGMIVIIITSFFPYSLYLQGGRATGVMNAVVFGNLAVSLFFIVLVFSQHESFKHKVFTLSSLFCGFLAIIASGTRGAWLSFLILLGVYLYFYTKQKTKFQNKIKFIVVLFIVSLLLIGSFNQFVNIRLLAIYTQTSSWMTSSEIEYKTVNSVNERLVMYKTAIDNIEDVPFFGHGYRTSNIVLFQNDSSALGKLAVGYNHLHNAYLTNYFNGGIVLLGALLLILFVPLRIFIKANSQNRENPIFISGALLTLGYASYGMVSVLLGDTYMSGFYTFFLAIFMLLYAESLKTS